MTGASGLVWQCIFLQMFVGFSIRGWYEDILLDDPLFG